MDTETMPVPVKKSPRSHHAFVTYVMHLAACLDGNQSFLTVSPTAAQLKTWAGELAQANAKAKGGGPGVVSDRNSKRRDLELQVDHLVDNVKGTVKAQAGDAAAATAMILSTGLSVRKRPTKNKPPLAARNGSVSGEVVLIALAVARTAMYYWEYSLNQTNWVSVPETMTVTTTISGLTPGQMYYFRFRTKTRKGPGDYSDAVKLMVT